MSPRKYLGWLAAALLLSATNATTAGSITGSKHDFSTGTNNWTGGRICVACHAPHKADTSVTDAPLWSHANTTASYTFYSSPTMNAAAPTAISGLSKLCMSCHDGTVAMDNFGGVTTGTIRITNAGFLATSNLGTALNDDHPIGIVYNTALATADGSLFDPATKNVTIGSGTQTKTGTLKATILFNDKLECSSCHDVHNTFTADAGAKLVKVSQAGSSICLACHNK